LRAVRRRRMMMKRRMKRRMKRKGMSRLPMRAVGLGWPSAASASAG
jgi:hypothetical protein